ncbi:hypothetical protein DIPPA_26901 [Diplonema papillatum]|nr:hypothetical protein DIPPA_26901 [Diplonema papillatum]
MSDSPEVSFASPVHGSPVSPTVAFGSDDEDDQGRGARGPVSAPHPWRDAESMPAYKRAGSSHGLHASLSRSLPRSSPVDQSPFVPFPSVAPPANTENYVSSSQSAPPAAAAPSSDAAPPANRGALPSREQHQLAQHQRALEEAEERRRSIAEESALSLSLSMSVHPPPSMRTPDLAGRPAHPPSRADQHARRKSSDPASSMAVSPSNTAPPSQLLQQAADLNATLPQPSGETSQRTHESQAGAHISRQGTAMYLGKTPGSPTDPAPTQGLSRDRIGSQKSLASVVFAGGSVAREGKAEATQLQQDDDDDDGAESHTQTTATPQLGNAAHGHLRRQSASSEADQPLLARQPSSLFSEKRTVTFSNQTSQAKVPQPAGEASAPQQTIPSSSMYVPYIKHDQQSWPVASSTPQPPAGTLYSESPVNSRDRDDAVASALLDQQPEPYYVMATTADLRNAPLSKGYIPNQYTQNNPGPRHHSMNPRLRTLSASPVSPPFSQSQDGRRTDGASTSDPHSPQPVPPVYQGNLCSSAPQEAGGSFESDRRPIRASQSQNPAFGAEDTRPREGRGQEFYSAEGLPDSFDISGSLRAHQEALQGMCADASEWARTLHELAEQPASERVAEEVLLAWLQHLAHQASCTRNLASQQAAMMKDASGILEDESCGIPCVENPAMRNAYQNLVAALTPRAREDTDLVARNRKLEYENLLLKKQLRDVNRLSVDCTTQFSTYRSLAENLSHTLSAHSSMPPHPATLRSPTGDPHNHILPPTPPPAPSITPCTRLAVRTSAAPAAALRRISPPRRFASDAGIPQYPGAARAPRSSSALSMVF